MDGFEAIVRKTYAGIFSLSYRLSGSYDDAGDITQDTYLKALGAYSTLKDGEKAMSWLKRICINSYIDHYRKISRRGKGFMPEFPSVERELTAPGPGPADEVLAEEAIRQVHSQCYSIITLFLPLYQRIVFVLADIFAVNVGDIAAITGKSVPSVKSLLYRARRNVGDFTGKSCGIVLPDNICTCSSWLEFKNDIVWKRERLRGLLKERPGVVVNAETRQRIRSLFHNLPLMKPGDGFYEKLIKILFFRN